MNRRIVLGVVSGLAAVLLATGGTTLAAYSDSGSVDGNRISAGYLRVELGPDGTGAGALTIAGVLPGQTSTQLLWVQSAAGGGVDRAALYLNLHDLVDHAAPCSTSLGKADAEIAAGIAGCTVAGDTSSGTPAQGNLSRLLAVRIGYYGDVRDATGCAGSVPTGAVTDVLPAAGGDVHEHAAGTGTSYRLDTAAGEPRLVPAGTGVCLLVQASWPPGNTAPADPTAAHPADNAAQGDSFSLALGFTLVQVA